MSGFLKLPRKLKKESFLNDKPYNNMAAFIDLVYVVCFEDMEKEFNGRAYHCKRGEIVTSAVYLSNRWGWDRRKVKRFLDELQESLYINYVTIPGNGIRITVNKYDSFNGDNRSVEDDII